MNKQPKIWIDRDGKEVPAKYVQKFDKERDAVSRRIHKRFMDERKRLEQLVVDSIADLDALMKLKESVGAKGLRVGGAFVWTEHANVIVRGAGATASDVLALARLMALRVGLRLGVALEPEVCGVGFAAPA